MHRLPCPALLQLMFEDRRVQADTEATGAAVGRIVAALLHLQLHS